MAKPSSHGSSTDWPQPLDTMHLAVKAQAVLDVPRRTRTLLVIAGILGVGLAFMASLVGGKESTVEIDKVIHFLGYSTLACVFVLALRPLYMIPAFVALIGVGVAIEIIQPFTGRSRDMGDVIANTIGISVGAFVGFGIRLVYAWIRRELAAGRVRKNLMEFAEGEFIFREGEDAKEFYLVKAGLVRITREVDGMPVELAAIGPGEAIGVLGVVRNEPHAASATAVMDTTLYAMSLDRLMEDAGGREQPVSTVLRTLADKLSSTMDALTAVKAAEQRE